MEFDPGHLGMEISRSGAVRELEQERQAQRVGVQLGWRLKTIDDDPYSQDLLSVYQYYKPYRRMKEVFNRGSSADRFSIESLK